jgi:hypothetical protein
VPERIYTLNDRHVSAETFAAIVSDLLAAGWTLTPPTAAHESEAR